MDKIAVWGFRWAPPFAQGLVRDLRVRWALEEAGQSYEMRLIDPEERGSAAYRRHQPFGQIPAFEADGCGLFESGAIVHHIAEGCAALMPGEARARAEVIAWMYAALNTVELPIWNLLEMDLIHAGEDWVKQRRPAVVEKTQARLETLAARLQGREYLGGRFSAADVLMVTTLRFIRHTDLVAGFPVVEDYVRRCEARPAFQKALMAQLADYARNAPIAA